MVADNLFVNEKFGGLPFGTDDERDESFCISMALSALISKLPG